jgi:hypothetical protein
MMKVEISLDQRAHIGRKIVEFGIGHFAGRITG